MDFDDDDGLLSNMANSMLEQYIKTAILPHIIEEERDAAFSRAKSLGLKYDWYDSMKAMDVLGRAAMQDRFDEFAERLENEYERMFSYASPNAKVRTPQKVKDGKYLFLDECMRRLDDTPPEVG